MEYKLNEILINPIRLGIGQICSIENIMLQSLCQTGLMTFILWSNSNLLLFLNFVCFQDVFKSGCYHILI